MEAFFGKKRAPGGALVCYATRHGQTQRYAERIAQPLDALIKDAAFVRASKVPTYDAVVLGCCVYQGKVQGLDFIVRNRDALAGKRLAVFTCGILDPAQADVAAGLDAQVREALGTALADMPVFHLRGTLRWRSLGVIEHVKVKGWLNELRQKPHRSDAEEVLLSAEGGIVDYSDEVDLAPIIAVAQGRKGL